jgi:Mg-chelatase subunit ChlD
MLSKSLVKTFVLFVSAICSYAYSGRALAETNVMFIVDASGSMKKAIDTGESRMTAAKRVLTETLSNMPKDARLGLMVYGHRKAKDCSDIELMSPIAAEDAAGLAAKIKLLNPKGETPIAAALQQAAKSFAAFKGQSNSIVLVTDGLEECGGDPCAAAKAIKDAGLDLKVNIVGFTLKDEQRKLIQCVADETGGTYYDAKNAAGLTKALHAVEQQVVQAAPPPPPDTSLISAKNGGVLVAAPSDEWKKLNDGSEERVTTYSGEGVWAFKDGKPATFDTFEVFIPGTYNYNLKNFELLAGDEGPLGQFRSIGNFAAQNVKMMESPYQKFTFPAVTARYLKVIIKDGWGEYSVAYEFRLQGKLDETAAGTVPATAPQGTDLLAAKNGGVLVAAPSDEWKKLNDGSEERVTTYSGEGVWAFKDGKPATFDTFEVFIPSWWNYNLKNFELLAGDEGPTGQFRSIGNFATANTKLMQSLYQRFTFPAVTAKYLKVIIKDGWGEYSVAYEFRLWGKLDETAQAAAAPAAPQGINLLAQANGGVLLGGPNNEWKKLNDGSEERATTYNGEGIWAFKDEKPVTFSAFEVLIPYTDKYNLKDFELLVADDSPTGPYRSIGQFTTQNTKMVQSPYQRFTFPAVTARYLKVVLKSDHGGGYIACYEFRVIGQQAP